MDGFAAARGIVPAPLRLSGDQAGRAPASFPFPGSLMIESFVVWLFAWLAIPHVGLLSVFFVSLVSATLLPLGSEPAVFAVVKSNIELFWPAIVVGTVGNTIGGVINYWIGYGARQTFAKQPDSRRFRWMERHGAKTMLASWLPGIGDPICALAGWQRLPFWPCAGYLTMTWTLLYVPDGFWRWLTAAF